MCSVEPGDTVRTILTRTCEVLPPRAGGATIEQTESLSVASLLSLLAVVRDTGAPRSLLYARIDWAKLQGEAKSPPGTPEPHYARATYTREARREQRQRQLARRGGLSSLTRAIRAA